MNAQGRRFFRAFSNNVGPHFTQRRDHAVHRTPRESSITHQPALEGLSREEPGQKPHGRPRISAVDFFLRRG